MSTLGKMLLFCFFLYLSTAASTSSSLKNKILPGESSNSIDDLDPSFKRKVLALIKKMESKDYRVKISQTYRSQERQEFVYDFYKEASEIIGFDVRRTSTKHSKHSRVAASLPASCAIDLRPVFTYSIEEKAIFYRTLRDESVKMGMRSGANFEKRKSSPYYKYNLGYDPGHVEISCPQI
tara:strand:- start:182 stop:721 length:540 start_codon:yes stop_codon:yes gene_type:complete